MDIRKIKKLIELLEESGIEELEIQEGEESVRISRGSRHAAPVYAPQPARPGARSRGSPGTGSARPGQHPQRPHDALADGRHLLPLAVAGRRLFC